MIINSFQNYEDLNPSLDLLLQIISFNRESINSQGQKLINSLISLVKNERNQAFQLILLTKIVKCLGKCSLFEGDVVANQRFEVISALKPLLDHKKRLIRQETAQALNLWHVL